MHNPIDQNREQNMQKAILHATEAADRFSCRDLPMYMNMPGTIKVWPHELGSTLHRRSRMISVDLIQQICQSDDLRRES
jgi:hypothetical protein